MDKKDMSFIKYNLMILFIFIVSCMAIAKINFDNGKIEQCNDLGYYYTQGDGCLSCLETGRVYIHGECMIDPNSKSSVLDGFDLRLVS